MGARANGEPPRPAAFGVVGLKWPMLVRTFAALALLATTPALAQTPDPRARFADEVAALVQTDTETAAHCPILFVGSSSFRMWSSLKDDMAPVAVLNRGFGGSTVAEVNAFFDDLVAPFRPTAIFFYAGDNDIHDGAAPEKVADDFAAFMDKKTAALGPTPVYFVSVKPSPSRWEERPRQAAVNAAVKRLARGRRDLILVDVATPMLDRGRPRDIYLEDKLHMTPKGYAIWTAKIRPLVLAEAARRKSGCAR